MTRCWKLVSSGCRELRKKNEPGPTAGLRTGDRADLWGGAPDSIEAFLERLRDRCKNDGGCDGLDRPGRIQVEARCAVALADELGILKRVSKSWNEVCDQHSDQWKGSEHWVDFSEHDGRYHKTTLPPAFGLVPKVVSHPVVDLRSEVPKTRRAIEFVPGTPLEYLERWQTSNDLFGDDVRLVSVIAWAGDEVSFGITQPQYHGVPAEPREIEGFFLRAGWQRLRDPSGHVIFFNHAFGVMAIDAERRNCYITDGELQPFDVILRRPDEEMEEFLGIYG